MLSVHSVFTKNALILENRKELAVEMRDALRKVDIDSTVVSNIDELGRILEDLPTPDLSTGSFFDAVSLDTNQGGTNNLVQSLSLVINSLPYATRLIYSKRADEIRNDAFALGADACLEKRLDDGQQRYTDYMASGARLGRMRYIAKCLEELCLIDLDKHGIHDLYAPFPHSLPYIDAATSAKIYSLSRMCAYQQQLSPTSIGEQFMDLLKREGQWDKYDSAAYISLPWTAKLCLMCDFAQISIADFAAISGTSTEEATAFINWQNLGIVSQPDLQHDMETLLSLLSYTLRVARYDPGQMRVLWRDADFYKTPNMQPPWCNVGLCDYLKQQGRHAISNCYQWITKH